MAPPSDPHQRPRPGTAGFWIGAALILVGVVVGAVIVVFGFVRAVGPPDFASEFPYEGDTTVALEDLDEGTWRIYADRPVSAGQIDCEVEGPDPGASAVDTSFSHTVEVGSDYWELVKEIQVSEPGQYQISCSGADDLTYGVAQGEGAASTVGMILLGAAIGVGGVVLGAILLIVTAVRRNRARPGGHGGPPPGYPPAPGW